MHFSSPRLALLLLPSLALCNPEPDLVPSATREHWMQRAIDALYELTDTPCPAEAFGAAIVNHSDTSTSAHGELICLGVNSIVRDGNPTLHGRHQSHQPRRITPPGK